MSLNYFGTSQRKCFKDHDFNALCVFKEQLVNESSRANGDPWSLLSQRICWLFPQCGRFGRKQEYVWRDEVATSGLS